MVVEILYAEVHTIDGRPIRRTWYMKVRGQRRRLLYSRSIPVPNHPSRSHQRLCLYTRSKKRSIY